MLDNLNKASERSGKLEDLEDRADQLLAKVRRHPLAPPPVSGAAAAAGSCSGTQTQNSHPDSCLTALFLDRHFLSFAKMNEVSRASGQGEGVQDVPPGACPSGASGQVT